MKTSIFRSNPWIIVAPGAALAVAYLAFVYLPGQRAINALREQVTNTEQYVEQGQTMALATEATRQEFERTRSYVGAWEDSAPSEDELSGLFGRISRLAKDSGTTTVRFDPQPAAAYDKVRRIPVTMACAGSFGQISEFLRGLEGLDQTVWIESLQMEGSGENEEDVQCELTLGIFAGNPDDSDQVDRSG